MKDMQKDFWGEPKREKKDKWESELQQYDSASFPDRLRRLRLIAEVMTSPAGYLLHSQESAFLFEDAKNCFIFDQFSACILVCQALLEHQLKGIYCMAGKDNLISMGFKRLIKHALEDRILPDFIISKLDELRSKRNPLVHPQEEVLGSYAPRALALNVTPEELLEQDAKEAVLVTFEILNRHPFGLR